jgi:flagellar protein FlbD
MIKVTRLNGSETVINAELIESVEATPDTVISLTTGHRYVVHESVDEIIARVVAYRRACRSGPECREDTER